MATIYEVMISLTRNHDGSDYPVELATLQLVDGESDVDRWSVIQRISGSFEWPEAGAWTRSPSAGTVDIFSSNLGDHFARLEVGAWPWRKATTGKIEFVRSKLGAKKGEFTVKGVE